MLFFKSDVDIRGLTAEALLGLFVTYEVFQSLNQKLTVTSVRDGRHKDGSLHHSGKAFDIRIFDLRHCSVDDIYMELCRRLPAGFQIVREVDHIHVEFDYG